MQIDPIIVALAGTITTLSGFLYRALIHRAERAEAGEAFWRDRWLAQAGRTDLALDEAERREH